MALPKSEYYDTMRIVYNKPDVNKIQSFVVPKQTGVNYNAGIWHFPLISMKNMNFLIVDRKGKGNNLVIY